MERRGVVAKRLEKENIYAPGLAGTEKINTFVLV
jgi:hypothetical protein